MCIRDSVDAEHLIVLLQQPLAQVAAEESGTAGDDGARRGHAEQPPVRRGRSRPTRRASRWVRERGLEPLRPQAPDPKSDASTIPPLSRPAMVGRRRSGVACSQAARWSSRSSGDAPRVTGRRLPPAGYASRARSDPGSGAVATQVHAGPHDETDLILDRRGLRRVWIIGFVLMFLTIATWSLAMPLSAAPDEPAQYIKAAAVVRGNFGSRPSAQPGLGLVRAPHFFGTAALNPACFAFGPNTTTASRVRAVNGPGDDRKDDVTTGAAPYPPLYYLLVGAPLLSAPSFTALYVARLLSAAVSAAFLASAFVAAAEGRRRRLPVLGVLIAATPTIYFFAGAVNPAGFEATTAICLWASLLR